MNFRMIPEEEQESLANFYQAWIKSCSLGLIFFSHIQLTRSAAPPTTTPPHLRPAKRRKKKKKLSGREREMLELQVGPECTEMLKHKRNGEGSISICYSYILAESFLGIHLFLFHSIFHFILCITYWALWGLFSLMLLYFNFYFWNNFSLQSLS